MTILTNRLCRWHSLLFFVACLFLGCHPEEDRAITITPDGKTLMIGTGLTKDIPADSIRHSLQVRIKNTATPIFGALSLRDKIIFTPLLSFSPGMEYEVFLADRKLGSFAGPAFSKERPQLVKMYPDTDTLPENLLKIYLHFSHPMQEGRSAGFIHLLTNGTDTLHDVFLDLQPELWNKDRTVLTLWLDPGRIKRDLQPNLKLGAPLKSHGNYRLVVSAGWKDARGIALAGTFTHSFITRTRDSLGPDPRQWFITDTTVNGKHTICIDLRESLDHFLLQECLSVYDTKGAKIKGNFVSFSADKNCVFIPDIALQKGKYQLSVLSKLEDLAGNNLNRPFDRDILHSKQPSTAVSYTREFEIK